ncbi:maleylpyruvate isomerase family mycothiol-dependent enzyme [Kitasatospora sp. NPDC057015]|uniref:maleylpyruvate isomerase family mycothiol-dependent enzyme n=1 Tax=Kitasatospora sp. NPDC057015 TaxID=3346001 RepID=UPI003645E732
MITDDDAAAPERWERLTERQGYERTRESITGLLAGRPELSGVPVAACPGWTVRDVLAHLLDVCKGVVNGVPRLPLERPDPDNEADLAELLGRWPGLSAQLPDRFEGLLGYKMTMDILTHELDLRRALGEPVPAEPPALPGSMDLVTLGMGLTVIDQGLPALLLETPGASWLVGRGDPVVTVRGHRHDLFRSLTGRRTLRQIARLDWSEPPDKWLPAFTWPPFQPPEEPFEPMADGS